MTSTPRPSRRPWLWPALWLLLAAVAVGAWGWPRWQAWSDLKGAQAALVERDYAAASKRLRAVLERNPDHPEGLFLQARVARHQGDLSQYEESLKRARELGFAPQRIQVEESLLQAQNGLMDLALPQLPRLLQLASETDGQEICEAYVNGFFSTYNFPEAFKLLEVWQKDYPLDAQPYYCRGLYETHVGSETEAVKELRRALELAPQRDEIRRFLAEGLIDLEQFEEAEQHIRYLVQRQPGNVDLTTALAHCLLEKGDLGEARRVLESQLKIDPESPPARLVMGQLEIREQHPEEALRWLEPIVKARPFEYNARFQYATALQHAGRGSEAVEHLKFVAEAQAALGRARNLMDKAKDDPEDVASRLEIGQTLLKYDSPDDGAHWLRNVLQLEPGNVAAHSGLADYYERQANEERAEFHRRRAGLSREQPAEINRTESEPGDSEGTRD